MLYRHFTRVIGRPEDRWLRVLVDLLVIVAVTVAGLVAWLVTRPDPFDPVTFEPQRVEAVDERTGEVRVPTVPGFDGIPAIRLGDPVPVTGVRCSTADTEITVTADLWWSRVDQLGTRIEVLSDFSAPVPPGCFPLRFRNDIPAEVAAIVAAENEPSQWRLVGAVTPTREGGVTSAWSTESFWLLP